MIELIKFYEKIYQNPMIREPGNPKRIDTPLRSVEDVEDFVNKCKGNKPAFMSIYSYSEDYKVRYEPGANGKDTRIAEYPQPIFDRIILDFDIPKEDLLKAEGYNSEDLRVKGEELLKEEGKAVNKGSAIRRGKEYYLQFVKDNDANAIRSLTKGKKVSDRHDIIMNYFYQKYTSSEYLVKPYKDAIKVSEFVQSQFQVKPLLFFSGGHGIHLHIYFNPVDISNVDAVVEEFGLKLKENLELSTLDDSVVKSVHQHLIRIPLSRHQGTKLYVTPFDTNTSYFEVMDKAVTQSADIDIDSYINQDTRLLEDFLYSYSEYVDKLQSKVKPNNLNYDYTLTGSLFDLREPFARIYQEGQRNLTAYPLLHFFKGANIPKEDAEEFIRTLPGGNGLDKNEQSWVDTAYSTDKPYQDNMGHLVNTIKRYASNEDESKYIIAKFNEYFNSSTNIPGEVELSPGLVQFHNNQYYKDGIYNKQWNKDKESYDYIFKGNILLHELSTTYDVLGEFNPVRTIQYTNTTINKTFTIEDKSLEEISQRIYKAQLIDTNIQGIESILRKISIHSVNKDLQGISITANEDLFMNGFFYDENQDKILHNNEFNDLESSKEDVQDAIKLVNEIISNRGTAKPNDATVFRCMLWSPYSYALKQLGFNKSLYGLVLWGVRDTNKTGSCENYSYLYNNPTVINQDADTPSAFGSRLGENTYNLLVDEAWNLLSNKDNEEVLKKAITNKTARAVKNKYNNDAIDEFYALRIPIYTLNDIAPVMEKEEFKKRYKVVYYDNTMKLSKKAIKDFIKKYKPQSPTTPLNQLKHLGKVFADKFEAYLQDKSDKLHDLEALTVDILKDIAKEYDTPFDTAYTTIQEFDTDEEDLGSKIRDGLNKLFFKNHKTLYGYEGITNADFEFSARYGEFTWLDYQPTNERYVIHVKEFEKEINNITREYIQIEDIFDALDITLNLDENKQGFKTYTKFKGKTQYAVKIKEFDLIFKMFKMDIFEEGQVDKTLEQEAMIKQRQEDTKKREQEFDKIVNAKVIK